MKATPFPAKPRDVVALTVQEFTGELDRNETPSFDAVSQMFHDDVNRALVWLIRFRALQAWCARPDAGTGPSGCRPQSREACEIAASFVLNDNWEFDDDRFRSAVASASSRRSKR